MSGKTFTNRYPGTVMYRYPALQSRNFFFFLGGGDKPPRDFLNHGVEFGSGS